ncbi:5-formyltetrahydrofolate cyclo-ligase [Shewanella waksmanii]|uniref:5-formyltetrahydrofolate cyclo-ligase n=1 Tax=Shewanella waksmanii TaxID=213783 RepID=UPI0004920041|nr:5-formyltetrahydrofolate cyclo-ligase [Shewanella waksmanii]
MPAITPSLSPATADLNSRQTIRARIRQARRELSFAQQQQYANTAMAPMLAALLSKNARSVAAYLSNDGELDTRPLIDALWSTGIDVYLPRLHPFSKGNLIFLRYQPTTPLQKNHLGIWEPALDIRQLILPQQLDVVITPLVAFDSQGNRMGMGGGYYDRTLANWQQQGKPLPVGYAHNCQQVAKLDQAHWDVPLPLIVTPQQVFEFVK